MRILLAIILIQFVLNGAFAHDEDESYNLRVLQVIDLTENTKVYLTARDNGHVLGQPVIVETRVSCKGLVEEPKSLPVHDSYSVCDLQPTSVKVNANKTAVAVKTKAANIDAYYLDIEKGKEPDSVSCHAETKILKFSLKNLCSKG